MCTKRGIDPKDVRVYDKGQCILFNSYKTDGTQILSNLCHLNITYDGMQFNSSEQLFFYLLTMTKPELQKAIMRQTTPKAVKHYVKDKELDTTDETKIIYALRTALRAKANSVPYFRDYLTKTGTVDIVEDAFWWDLNYGCREKDGVYVGKNTTGRLLMELREQLQKNAF